MGAYSFTKEDRILKRSEFIHISKYGKKNQNAHFIAKYVPCICHRIRVGITVSKKVGNAVVRNRVKRIIREYFRLNKGRFNQCWDINIIAKKQAANLTTEEAFSSLNHLLSKI